ncbi:MAG: hypothetical protein M3Z21_05545 [Pseudomonadota bacterium]|nr:hypothetical protein [Pseudomonadota bacterium]
MTLDDFLAELEQALTASVGIGTPGGPVPKVTFDPARRQATEPDQMLIGVGYWMQDGRPVEHRGVCLNNKGVAWRFGSDRQYASVTDLVLDPPHELSRSWEAIAGDAPAPGALLRRFELIVEDISPDSCFALLCWLALRCGVDADELRQGRGRPWVEAVRRWKATGMTGDPFTSWAALLSALGHSYIPPAGASRERGPGDLSPAWREALRFTVALLRRNGDPDAVPPLPDLDGYARAAAFMNSEYQDYRESLVHALRLQLLVPLHGTNDARRLPVDAYFAVETWPSGVKKIFIRTDREHAHLRQGFAVMGLYRPDEQGTGNDMTVSVNPQTGIYLKALWEELERLENERWQGARPQENPRPIASYPGTTGYTEPWWDDNGRYTLLGAPKRLPDGRPGSCLNWSDVVEAVWRCYHPLRDLTVRDALDNDRECALEQCRREGLPLSDGQAPVAKRLAAVRWIRDMARPQALFLSPTARRYFAALIARDKSNAPVGVAGLPEEADFDVVPLAGGFAVIHEKGVLLFDDWRVERLELEELQAEFRRAGGLLGEIGWVGQRLDEIVQEKTAASRSKRAPAAVLADLSTLRARLAAARQRFGPKSGREDVRRFRARLEERWGIEKGVETLYKRVAEIEDAARTMSALRTQRLVSILSTYGLPFFISSAITTFLSPWIKQSPWLEETEGWESSLLHVGVYLGVAGTLIGLVLLLQWVRDWRIERQRKVPVDQAGGAGKTAP